MGGSGRANPGGGGAQSPRESNAHGISGVSPEDQRIATEKRARAVAYSKGLKQGRRPAELPSLFEKRDGTDIRGGVRHEQPWVDR